VEGYRLAVREGAAPPDPQQIAAAVAGAAQREWRQGPVPVINATGVILHTNLGRAPLCSEALDAMRVASQYSDLELDLDDGQRGSRQEHVRWMLQALTGAEEAHVVVNNAAAVLLALSALARRRDVLVSRGQAVEIGGGFRVPAILRQSGARLVEVGTTNRTRLEDYESATTDRTAAILHVHSSNFRIVGFTESPDLADLAKLAHRRDLVLIDDNGSGSLLDTARFGLAHEPTPVESLRAGADVVAFSADKLLGGPQAGILLGRRDLLQRIAASPLARAVRSDKVAIAGLTATLRAYLRGNAEQTIPVWRMIGYDAEAMRRRAERWCSEAAGRQLDVVLQPGESTVGGGSLPGGTLPTTLISLPPDIDSVRLRRGALPVVARVRDGRVLLDLRTVAPEEEASLLQAVCQAAAEAGLLATGVAAS
jgi:L-seryl-tRNA(Ser) seleniumtransferase